MSCPSVDCGDVVPSWSRSPDCVSLLDVHVSRSRIAHGPAPLACRPSAASLQKAELCPLAERFAAKNSDRLTAGTRRGWNGAFFAGGSGGPSHNEPMDSRAMARVPSRVASRIASGLKRFQPILESAKARDINESDTVVVYDKYTEITSEYAIRGTFCDLAIRLDGELVILIEVKAIGSELKGAYIKQAVDYAANQGVDWVVLTNGILWNVYRLTFAKPIDSELVAQICLCELNPKDEEHVERLWMLSKEGWQRSALDEHHKRGQAFNRFTLGAMLLSQPMLETLRREIRRSNPGLKIECEEIEKLLSVEVIKRDVLEGDKADQARKSVNRAIGKASKPAKTISPAEDVALSHGEKAGDACSPDRLPDSEPDDG